MINSPHTLAAALLLLLAISGCDNNNPAPPPTPKPPAARYIPVPPPQLYATSRPAAETQPAGDDAPFTFNRDIAPIVFSSCANCHRPEEVGPFPLLTYKDVKDQIANIVPVVQERRMPPWKPVPGHGNFIDDRSLTPAQIAAFVRWQRQGMPEGDPRDLPPLPSFPTGWMNGTPDLVLKVPEPFLVPAEGPDLWQCFVIPIDIPTDKYVSMVEFRPSNRKVVHHAQFFLDSTGAGRALDAKYPGVGYPNPPDMLGIGFIPITGLGGWVPGYVPHPLPQDSPRVVKKGSDLVVQVHYRPSGAATRDQPLIGLHFTDKKPTRSLAALCLSNWTFNVPPGDAHYAVADTLTIPTDVTAMGVILHAHLICRDMKIWATLPDGSVRSLIWIDDWDFYWQEGYNYKDPVRLPAGTKIDMLFNFDNSSANPFNPSHPPKRVTYGIKTTDEMAETVILVIPDHPDGYKALRDARRGTALEKFSASFVDPDPDEQPNHKP